MTYPPPLTSSEGVSVERVLQDYNTSSMMSWVCCTGNPYTTPLPTIDRYCHHRDVHIVMWRWHYRGHRKFPLCMCDTQLCMCTCTHACIYMYMYIMYNYTMSCTCT